MLCNILQIQYTTEQLLYTAHQILYTTQQILYTTHQILYTTHQILYSTQQILYTTHQILYTTQQILFSFQEAFLNVVIYEDELYVTLVADLTYHSFSFSIYPRIDPVCCKMGGQIVSSYNMLAKYQEISFVKMRNQPDLLLTKSFLLPRMRINLHDIVNSS